MSAINKYNGGKYWNIQKSKYGMWLVYSRDTAHRDIRTFDDYASAETFVEAQPSNTNTPTP